MLSWQVNKSFDKSEILVVISIKSQKIEKQNTTYGVFALFVSIKACCSNPTLFLNLNQRVSFANVHSFTITFRYCKFKLAFPDF